MERCRSRLTALVLDAGALVDASHKAVVYNTTPDRRSLIGRELLLRSQGFGCSQC